MNKVYPLCHPCWYYKPPRQSGLQDFAVVVMSGSATGFSVLLMQTRCVRCVWQIFHCAFFLSLPPPAFFTEELRKKPWQGLHPYALLALKELLDWPHVFFKSFVLSFLEQVETFCTICSALSLPEVKGQFQPNLKEHSYTFLFSFLKWMAWGWKPKGVLPTARQQSILVRTAGNGSPTDTTEENRKICRNGKKVIHTEWEAVQDEWWKLLFSLMWNEVIIGAKISAAHRWYFLVQLRTFCESKGNLYPDCLSVYVAVLLGCSGDQAVRSAPPSALGCLLHLREAKAASRCSTWVATNYGATDMPEQQQVVTLPAGHPTSQVRH